MSLFVCTKCDCVENTALVVNFWGNLLERGGRWAGERLCSECERGKWHGRFEKTNYVEWMEKNPDYEPSVTDDPKLIKLARILRNK